MKKLIYLFSYVLLILSCNKSKASDIKTANNKAPQDTASNTISFSGYTWIVKTSGDEKTGPGPNNWSGDNAYVDASGNLHLKLTKKGNQWYCAEVTSTQSFGYGIYQWDVEGRTDTLDKNVILGLFNYSDVDGRDEMDIELSRWGHPDSNNTNYTIYPAQEAADGAYWHKTFNTTLVGEGYTTQRFTRNGDKSVFFQELGGFQDGDANLIDSVTCINPPSSISKLAMPVHMNLWLFQGMAPANQSNVEIIIHRFKFTAQ